MGWQFSGSQALGEVCVPFFGVFRVARDDALVARWSASPLGMLWPEMDAAFVTSNGNGSGGPDGRVMRSFAQCHSWHDGLTVQNEFTRASLERVCSGAARSAELTGEMIRSSFKPFQECTRQTVERLPRQAA